jgi:integrase
MARRRKSTADAWIPKYVRPGKSAWEYRPPGAYVRLCGLDADPATVIQAHANAKMAYDERKHRKGYTVSDMLADYITGIKRGDGRREPLSQRTIKDYEDSTVFLNRVIGDWLPNEVRPETLREYMDNRKVLKSPRKGEIAHKRANLELITFRNAWGYCAERAKVRGQNPAADIKLYEYIARERYVDDAEYEKVYSVAPKPVKVAMSIAWLCGARQGDVLKLVHGRPGQTEPEKGQDAVTLESGIYIAQGKTRRKQIKEWTPALRDAVEISKGMHVTPEGAVIVSRYVVHTKRGTRYTQDGFQAIWSRAVKAAGLPESFTFHDLKAKGISDVEGTLEEKRQFADHSTAKMTQKYDRKVSRVSALNPKKEK